MTKLPTMTPEELRSIRSAMGLKQYEAHLYFGVAMNTYKKWEQGVNTIPGPVALLALKYLHELSFGGKMYVPGLIEY